MGDILLGAGVLAVEIAVVGDEFLGRHLPRVVGILALLPPRDAIGEFLEMDGGRFGVILAAFREGLLVLPDFLRRSRTVKEQEIGRNAGIGRKYPIGQADNGVEVEFL